MPFYEVTFNITERRVLRVEAKNAKEAKEVADRPGRWGKPFQPPFKHSFAVRRDPDPE